MSFEEGSVFPMAMATSLIALIVCLGIQKPTSSVIPQESGLLIWGASSSVGTSALQLARNMGFKVFATASPAHHQSLKSLGALEVFDYHDSSVIDKIVVAAKVVAEQLGKRSSKLLCKTRPIKSSDQKTEIFRFTDLPPEIRDMVYKIYFTNSSGKKPGLLLAFKIDGVKVKGDFYNAAKQVYYTVNNWDFSIIDCLKNSILGNMDQVHVKMIRKMSIQIP
jgi:hypothetical protein